ncbi:MAG: prepilin-type N-terminal cleavage/methylation domain-containing protein [Campylobacteraceae bacterium]|jgi:prepilin-type N-terminal cleavage/methylation domain-containing protein|nr:prepilin-type N-terminal cleavage/methylation domain-containing protein [Campylobacteraceae bacterium]
MNRAFTLIEILICVVIIVTVGIGLLKTSSTSAKLISYAKSKSTASGYFSVLLLNTDVCEDKDTNMYDVLKTKFNIKDDELVSILKEEDLNCVSEEVTNIKLADTDINQTIEDISQISFVVNKISASFNASNIVGYEMKVGK